MTALLVGDDLLLGPLEPAQHRLHRLDDEEEHRTGNGDEPDHIGDERAVAEDGFVDREREIAEVGLAHDRGDDRHHEIADQRVDDGGERDAHHECHRKIEDVPLHEEVLELLDHLSLLVDLARACSQSILHRAEEYNHAVLGEVLTAVVTPFRGDGSVDIDAFRALCRALVENGSDGVVVTGTTGEAPTLTDDERLALYEVAVDELSGRHTVIAGTGTYATAHSIHLTERAHEIGVDGMLIVTPYYNKPPQRGIVAHVEAVAAVTDKPIVFYDIPSRVVVDAEPATIEALAAIENVRAVKQAKPSLDAARHVVACGLDLYAGDDDLIFPFLEVGGVGGICVHTHVVGNKVKEMIRRYRDGDRDGARALDEELRPAIDLLRVQTNPIAIKTALNLLGHDVGGFRLPLVEATPEEEAAVRSCLERLGLLAPVAA